MNDPEIRDGLCEASLNMKAQNRSTVDSDDLGLCQNDGWDSDLFDRHPELCTVSLHICPTCKVWLCRECWYAHPPEHFKPMGGLYAGEVVPLFWATEAVCGPYPYPEDVYSEENDCD